MLIVFLFSINEWLYTDACILMCGFRWSDEFTFTQLDGQSPHFINTAVILFSEESGIFYIAEYISARRSPVTGLKPANRRGSAITHKLKEAGTH